MLPVLTADGLLPSGRHPCGLQDVHQRFVVDAPEQAARQHLWNIFLAFVDCVKLSLPGATLWINGGFITHKEWAAPRDVDVLMLVDGNVLAAADQIEVHTLISLHDVECVPRWGSFIQLARLQPFGGRIDSFIDIRGDSATELYWHGEWSKVKGVDGKTVEGAVKGYVEVQL